MSPVKLLLILGRIVDDNDLGDEVKKPFRVSQGYETVILVIGLHSKYEVHLEVDVGLLESKGFIMDAPLIDIGLEKTFDDVVLNALNGNVLVVVPH